MNVLQLFVVPDAGDSAENRGKAEDMAWNHATSLAGAGMDIGSDQFVAVYEQLLKAYQHCATHFGYIQHLALRVIEQIIASGRVNFKATPLDDDGADAVQAIHDLALIVTSAMMYMYGSDVVAWIPNQEWNELDDELKAVGFLFELEDDGDE